MSTHHVGTSSHIRTSRRRKGQRLTPEQKRQAQDTFLKTFAMNANVRAACLAAGIDRSVIYQWLEKDTAFTVLYHEAEKDADDMIRAAIFQRAIRGYEKPVVSMGKIVYEETPVLDALGKPVLDEKGRPVVRYGKPLTETVYSDALLALLAKARMHEFREKQQVEMSGSLDVSGVRDSLLSKLASHASQDKKTS